MTMTNKLLAAAAMALVGAQADAAMTYKIENGRLTSVSGVVVNGATYDLAFVDGTCAAVFGDCGSAAAFQFGNGADASLASWIIGSEVLVNRVVVNGATYNFASEPKTVNGFGSRGGDILVPFAVNGSQVIVNGARGTYQNVYAYAAASDTTGDEYSVWAKFTPAASSPTVTGAVPEPTTWAMMMLGFGGLGYAMRRRPRASARIRFA